MKKKIILLFALVFLLCGCNPKGGNAEFTQKVLPAPERMAVQTGSATVEYLPGSPEYEKIFQALQSNWWKIAAEKPDTATDEALFMAESPEQLRFQSDRTYAESGDTFLYFYYEKEPFTWVNPTGPASKLTAVAFLLPNRVESEENVKGCFLTMEKTDAGYIDGLFTYYFPPEVAASFWDFVRK